MTRNTWIAMWMTGALALGGCGSNSDDGGGAGSTRQAETPAAHLGKESAALMQQVDSQLRWASLVRKDTGLAALTGNLVGGQLRSFVGAGLNVGGLRAALANNVGPAAAAGGVGMQRNALQAAGTESTDLDCQPLTGRCTATVTKTNPEAGVASEIAILVVDTHRTEDRADDTLLELRGSKVYTDGSTSTYVATETDGDNNPQTRAMRLTEDRTWPASSPNAEGKVREVSTITLVVGDLNSPADDVFLAFEGDATFADGHTGRWSSTDLDAEGEPGYRDIRVGRAQARWEAMWPATAPQEEGLSAQTLTIGVIQNSGATDEDDQWFSFEAHKVFRDGSSSDVALSEVDEPADGNLSTGLVRYHELRTWPEGGASTDGLRLTEAEYVVKVNGAGEADDETVSGRVHVQHVDGTDTTVEIAPETPIPHGGDLDLGVVRTRTTFPESAETVRSEQTVTATRDAAGRKTVKIESSAEYRNGLTGTESSVVTFDDAGNGTVTGVRRDGVAYSGTVSQTTGAWSITHTFAAGGEITSITEAGQWTPAAPGSADGSGTFSRTVVWADGRDDSVTTTTVVKEGDETRLDVTEADGGRGMLTLREGRFFTEVEATWTSAQGFRATWNGRRFQSGHSTLVATWDDPVTVPNPDVDAEFYFNQDGTGLGTVTVHNADGTTSTARVTVTPDGAGSAVDNGTGEEDVF